MASNNIDRTAVVKLAVLGVSSTDDTGNPIDYELQGQLHDFSYTLISDSGGDSYQFKLELINFNDTIHHQLMRAFQASLNRDRADNRIVSEKQVLEGFPKLAIQWGYPDALSNVHMAQLSDIKYKFTQAKEKILIIEAVNAGDWAKQFYLNASITPKRVSMNTDSYLPFLVGEGNLSISKTIIEIFQGALIGIRGINTSVRMLEADFEELDKEIEKILKVISPSFKVNPKAPSEAEKAAAVGVPTYPTYSTPPDYLPWGDGKDIANKYQALTRFFNLIGLDFINLIDVEDFRSGDNNDIKVYPITGKPIIKGAEGIHGEVERGQVDPENKEVIGYIAENQLNRPGRLENLANASKATNTLSTAHSFNSNSGNSEVLNNISARVNQYNNNLGPGDFPVSIENVTISIDDLNPDKLRQLEAGENVRIVTTRVNAINDNGDYAPNFPSKPAYLTLTPNTVNLQGTSMQRYGKNLTYEVQLNQQEKNIVNDVVSESAAERFGKDLAIKPKPVTYESLLPAEKNRFLYGNIDCVLHSEDGTSVLDSVKNSISKFNKLMNKSSNYLFMVEEDLSYPSKIWSFNEVVDSLNAQPDDSRFKSSTSFIFSKGSKAPSHIKGLLDRPESFPSLVNENDEKDTSSIINISYGKSDSIVKYFDFNGDIRYLANMQASLAAVESFNDVYRYLKSDTQIQYINVIDYLLGSYDFRDKLADKFKADNNFIKNLEVLREQLKPSDKNISKKDLEGLNFEFLLKTDFISSYLIDERDAILEDINNEKALTATEVFFATISTNVGIAALFKSEEIEKSDRETRNDIMQTIYDMEEGVEPTIPAKSFTYHLVEENPFDIYSKTRRGYSKRELAMLEAYYKNLIEPWEVKIKTLGIPEIDRLVEIIAPRYFNFKVHDLSRELQTDRGNQHWISGIYRPMAVNHKINNSVGYITEFTLLKEMGQI